MDEPEKHLCKTCKYRECDTGICLCWKSKNKMLYVGAKETCQEWQGRKTT